ncbi:MAG: EamA family transporter [Clostridium fessum]
MKQWGSIPATGMGMFIGGVFLSGAVRIWEVPAGLDGHAAFYLGVLVILGSAVAYTLFLKGVSLTGPVRASVLAHANR